MLKILAAAALAAMLALNICGASPALADIIWHEVVKEDHFYNVYDDKGNFKYVIVYDKNHKYIGTFGSNPKPEGGSTGEVDYKALIKEAMKNGGSEFIPRVDPYKTPLGKHLMGKTIVPHHNPADFNPGSFQPADGGAGGGTGGFDPMGGSIVDQMKKQGSKNKDDGKDDGGSDGGQKTRTADQFPGLMELVKPVPIDLPAALPEKNKAKLTHKPAGAAKIDVLMGKLPGPAQASNQNRASPSSAVPVRQPAAAAMQLPSAVGGLAGRTQAPSSAKPR